VRGALAACALALALAAGASAQSVRSEGQGTAPLPGAPGAASPRNVALEAALADAVEKVAAGLVGGTPGPAATAALREALGPNPGRFAQGYRGVSERERVRTEGPGRELAVTIEAQVDRTRVAEALRRAGLLAEQATAPAADAARRIVIEPLPSWPALAALRRRLIELGAGRVQLERVEPERAVLAIEGERSAASLVAALVSAPPPGVAVARHGDADGAPRIRLDGVLQAPGETPAPIDTPAAKR
jgi:hypothetical protein